MSDTLLVSASGTGAASVNWGTMVENLKRVIHRSGDVDSDVIGAALCKAMRHYRWERFHFNETSHYMWFLDGVDRYLSGDSLSNVLLAEPAVPDTSTCPQDIIKIDNVTIRGEDDDWWRVPMEAVTIEEIRYWRRSTSHESTPRMYAWYGNAMEIYPTPNQNFLVKIDYVRDIGTPSFEYTPGSGWSVQVPWTHAPMYDSWESDYFKYADEMITYRAMADVYANYLEDQENAAQAAFAAERAHHNQRKARSGLKTVRRVATAI